MLEGLGLVLLFWFGITSTVIGACFIANPFKVRVILRLLTGIALFISVLLHGFLNFSNSLSLAGYSVSMVLLVTSVIISLPAISLLRARGALLGLENLSRNS
jgi:hypothetical protein